MNVHSPFINRYVLLRHLRQQFQIDWWGHHGIAHWARVRANGLMLVDQTGANRHVVELFSFFHDSRRFNEHVDDGHGARGALIFQNNAVARNVVASSNRNARVPLLLQQLAKYS